MLSQDANNKMKNVIWDDTPVDVTEEVNLIWSIANKLRGPYQSDKYKNVIIPMTIIRRFECALEQTKQAVLDKVAAMPNVPDKVLYKTAGYAFYNKSRFSEVFSSIAQKPKMHTPVTIGISRNERQDKSL